MHAFNVWILGGLAGFSPKKIPVKETDRGDERERVDFMIQMVWFNQSANAETNHAFVFALISILISTL